MTSTMPKTNMPILPGEECESFWSRMLVGAVAISYSSGRSELEAGAKVRSNYTEGLLRECEKGVSVLSSQLEPPPGGCLFR